MFSPGYGIIQTMDTPTLWTYPEFSFWLSMLWQWLVAAALIARSSDHIPHSWEESAVKKKPRLARLKLAARVRARSAKGRAWLERNPFLWLAMQDEEASPRNVWLFVLAIWAIWVIAVLNFGMINMGDARMVTVTIFTLHIPLLIWIAAEASRRFSEDRSNNTFETLLSTPLSARQIIRGQWLALLRQFAAPIAVVLVWELLMEINGDAWSRGQLRSCWPRTLLLAPDAAALAWAGMWLGLKCKGRIRAILGSMILVLLLPWLVRTVVTGVIGRLIGRLSDVSFSMGPGYPQHEIDFEKWLMTVSLAIQLLVDFLIVFWAALRLPRTFRQLAVRR